MMAFPDILVAIALVAILGGSVVNVMIALSVVYAPRFARISRASTLVIRNRPFVEAARAAIIDRLHHPQPCSAQHSVAGDRAGDVHLCLCEAGLRFWGGGGPVGADLGRDDQRGAVVYRPSGVSDPVSRARDLDLGPILATYQRRAARCP
jgi:hypothetical protein